MTEYNWEIDLSMDFPDKDHYYQIAAIDFPIPDPTPYRFMTIDFRIYISTIQPGQHFYMDFKWSDEYESDLAYGRLRGGGRGCDDCGGSNAYSYTHSWSQEIQPGHPQLLISVRKLEDWNMFVRDIKLRARLWGD